MKKILRILEHIEKQGLNVSDFERRAGFSNGYLINTKKRDSDVSGKALTKLKKNLPEAYFAIFQEEQPGGMTLDDPQEEYERTNSTDLKDLLKQAMAVIRSNQKIMEENVALLREQHSTIAAQHGTIDKQQGTIHELAVVKKTKASA